MSDTPRTDQAVRECLEQNNGAVWFECKALERDLNSANEKIKQLEAQMERVEHRRQAAEERVSRLLDICKRNGIAVSSTDLCATPPSNPHAQHQ